MPIKTKRWNDPREADDGYRILITRYRPRGLPKGQETWDVWIPDLGPSRGLLAAFHGKQGQPISWSVYRSTYLKEMKQQMERIAALAGRVQAGDTITLLCSSACVQESRCHRSLLKGLIEQELAALGK